MVSVRVYVEGGSPGKLESKCRKAFSQFFMNAGLSGHMPRVIACGSRNNALRKFRTALAQSGSEEIPLLLVDGEERVGPKSSAWQHLESRDGWRRPAGARVEHAHLMVQCMESWFLADVAALESFFGPGFRSTALPRRNDIENISKDDVFKHLKTASKGSKRRAYDKGNHSFEILAQIDPEKVTYCSAFAKRMIDILRGLLLPS